MSEVVPEGSAPSLPDRPVPAVSLGSRLLYVAIGAALTGAYALLLGSWAFLGWAAVIGVYGLVLGSVVVIAGWDPESRRRAHFDAVLNSVAATAILVLLGQLHGPLVGLYGLAVLGTALVGRSRHVIVAASASVVSYLVAVAATEWGWIPDFSTAGSPVHSLVSAGVLIALGLLGSLVFAARLRSRAQEAEERYRAIFDAVDDAIVVFDPRTGGQLEVNPAASRMAGLSREQMLDRTIWDMLPEEEQPLIRDRIERLLRGADRPGVHRLNRADDATLYVQASSARVRVNGREAVVSVLHDQTDQIHAFEALARRARQQAAVAELGYLGLGGADPSVVLRRAADHAARGLGVELAEVLELDDSGVVLGRTAGVGWRPDTVGRRERLGKGDDQLAYALEAPGALLFEDLTAETRFQPSETLVDHGVRSGISVAIQGSTTPLGVVGAYSREGVRFSSEDVHFLQSVGNVISAALGRARAERALIRAKRDAEAANRAKTEFLANVSHEVRTPLTALLGFAELLGRDDAIRTGSEDWKVALRTLHRSAIQVGRIIDDILDIARIESGRLHVEVAPCDVRSLVEETLAAARVAAASKDVAVEVEWGPDVPSRFRTDQTRLRQILSNVVANAVKFTDRGSVRVEVRGDPCGRLRFVVRDTGIGMTREELDRVGEPFVQADSSITRRFGGTGLGLAISKRLAALLDGRVELASAEGEGTSVTIEIPELAAPASDGSPTNREEPGSRLARRVLVVEDDPDVRTIVATLLRREGASVTVASEGKAAVEIALRACDRKQPFDVVLMDLRLPDLDGLEAVAELRRRGHAGAVVALTAFGSAEQRRRARAAGCDDFVTKPVESEALVRIVGRYRAESPPVSTSVPG